MESRLLEIGQVDDKENRMKCKFGAGESKRKVVEEMRWGNGSAAGLKSRKR